MSKRTPKTTEYGRYVAGFLADECCYQPMQSGFDVMWISDEQTERNAYYRMCNQCGNIEVRTPEELRRDFDYEKEHGTQF